MQPISPKSISISSISLATWLSHSQPSNPWADGVLQGRYSQLLANDSTTKSAPKPTLTSSATPAISRHRFFPYPNAWQLLYRVIATFQLCCSNKFCTSSWYLFVFLKNFGFASSCTSVSRSLTPLRCRPAREARLEGKQGQGPTWGPQTKTTNLTVNHLTHLTPINTHTLGQKKFSRSLPNKNSRWLEMKS